jgi:predicted histone-like DNA-binding protein
MKYRIIKSTHVTSKGKYVARAIHGATIHSRELEKEVAHNCTATPGDVKVVISELMAVMQAHLREGARVKIDGVGTFKLELRCKPTEKEEDFDVNNIYDVAVHFIPESYKGQQALYHDLKLEKMP